MSDETQAKPVHPETFWPDYHAANIDLRQFICAGPGQPCPIHNRIHDALGDEMTARIRELVTERGIYREPEFPQVKPPEPISSSLARPAARPRNCDLKGCTAMGKGAVTVNITPYTGVVGAEATLIICEAHLAQLETGFITGFIWAPVYKR